MTFNSNHCIVRQYGQNGMDDHASASYKWAWTEDQWFLVLHLWEYKRYGNGDNQQSTYRQPLKANTIVMISLPPRENQCQRIVNDYWSWIVENLQAMHHGWSIINLSDDLIAKNAIDDIATTSSQWASTERQQFLILNLGSSTGYGTASTHNQSISSLYR
jgi:hypothetical protein